MAVVKFYSGPFLPVQSWGSVFEFTSTSIKVGSPDAWDWYIGSFTFDAAHTMVTGGTVNEYRGYIHGVQFIQISGLSMWAPQVQSLVLQGDPLLVLKEMMGGDDTVTPFLDSDHPTYDAILHGYRGQDTLTGGPGHDQLYGDEGDDVFNAGPGDSVYGGEGYDRLAYLDLSGAAQGITFSLNTINPDTTLVVGSYSITGVESFVKVLAGGFDDSVTLGFATEVYGLAGNDHLAFNNAEGATAHGGDGNDSISAAYYAYGDAGDDSIVDAGSAYGGEGNDSIVGAYLAYGGGGNDSMSATDASGSRLEGEAGNDTLKGGQGGDTLMGGDGDDWIETGAGPDLVEAGAGNDFVIASFAANMSLDGGDGIDTLSFASTGARVTYYADNGLLYFGGQAWFAPNFEAAVGTSFGDVLTAGPGGGKLDGAGGNDDMYGGVGNDTLLGGLGDDTLLGYLGNDSIDAGSGTDTAVYFSNASSYSIVWRADSSTFLVVSRETLANEGTDTLAGVEYFQFADKTVSVADYKGSTTPPPPGSAQLITGTDDWDTLVGGAGNDTLLGGGGSDDIAGDSATDLSVFGNDVIDGGPGIDTARYAGSYLAYVITVKTDGDFIVSGPTGQDTLTSVENIRFEDRYISDFQLFGDMSWATDDNDTIANTPGNNNVNAGAGLDTVVYSGKSTDYLVTAREWGNGEAMLVVGSATEVDQLLYAERVQIGNTVIAFDVEGNAGQAYRLYQAAFNRAPDAEGLAFQVHARDLGFEIYEIAQNFIDSPEFKATYGALDNTAFLTLLYRNVLHRDPDAQGLAYHLGNMEAGATRALVLNGFSESPENKANVASAIEHGMVWVTEDGAFVDIYGTAGNDLLVGGGQAETFYGGAGNDTMKGGPGVDTASFTAARSSFTITTDAAGTHVSGPDGVDLLIGIERLAFTDQVITFG